MQMKEMIAALAILGSAILATGCETAGQAKTMSSGGLEGVTCEQIRKAFEAYDADRSSFDALAELAGLTGYDLTNVAKNNADAYYAKARDSANIALVVKGCKPL
jgi:hypothetical protein